MADDNQTVNLTGRLQPLIERFQHLDQTDFTSDTEAVQTRMALEKNNFFTVPILEGLLAQAKRARDEILITDIPLLLAEYGLSEAKLTDGTLVTKETFFETSQSGKDKALLARWLCEHGYEQIIKDTVAFEKGSFDEKVEAFLASGGYSYSKTSDVNGQSLKKTIREHLLAGGELPPDEAVKVTIFERGVVKAPKEKKGF